MGSGPKATTNFQKNGDAAFIRSFCDSQKYFFFLYAENSFDATNIV